MLGEKKIDYTNLAIKKSRENLYAIIALIIVLGIGAFGYYIHFKDDLTKPFSFLLDKIVKKKETNEEKENLLEEVIVNYSELSENEKAQANAFILNSKSLYKVALSKRVELSMQGVEVSQMTHEDKYFESSLNYCIVVDKNNNFEVFQVSDGVYFIDLADISRINDIEVTNVKKGKLNDFKCE